MIDREIGLSGERGGRGGGTDVDVGGWTVTEEDFEGREQDRAEEEESEVSNESFGDEDVKSKSSRAELSDEEEA